MTRLISLLLLTLVLLSGCSSIGGSLLGMLGGSASKGIDANAEVVVGKKEEELIVDTQLGDNLHQQAQTIVNENEVPTSWVFLFALMCGWAIPGPLECGRGLILLLKTLLPWSR